MIRNFGALVMGLLKLVWKLFAAGCGGVVNFGYSFFQNRILGYMTTLTPTSQDFVSGAIVQASSSNGVRMTEFRNRTRLVYADVIDNAQKFTTMQLKASAISAVNLQRGCVLLTKKAANNGPDVTEKYCKGDVMEAQDMFTSSETTVEEACTGKDFFLVRLRKGSDLDVYYFNTASRWNTFISGRGIGAVTEDIINTVHCRGSNVKAAVDNKQKNLPAPPAQPPAKKEPSKPQPAATKDAQPAPASPAAGSSVKDPNVMNAFRRNKKPTSSASSLGASHIMASVLAMALASFFTF